MIRTARCIVVAWVFAGCGDDAGSITVDAPDEVVDAPPAEIDAAPDAALLPRLTFHDFMIAVDVSPDGRRAAFQTADAILMLEDTETGVLTDAGSIGMAGRVLATGIADTGAVTAYQGGEPAVAAVHGSGWTTIPSPYAVRCGEDEGAAWDVSADGSVVTGMHWNGCSPVAFRWTAATGSVPLAVLGAADGHAPTNRATVISDDGSVIAGFAENGAIDRAPAVWLADGTGLLLEESQDVPGEVLAISADGTTLAGVRGNDAFVWTSGTGFVALARLDGYLPGDAMFANTVTADGERVYGAVGSSFFSIPTAFVWTAAGGTQALVDLVRAAGIAVPETTRLENVLGVSADGKVLVGTGAVNDVPKTFTLRLP